MFSHLRKLRNRRMIRRCTYCCAGIVSLILLFYAEEDWRRKRDWERYKREWEAKGERFDFKSFVPPAVPDDQNFALTPIVASSYSSFVDRNGHSINPRNTNVVNRLDFASDIPEQPLSPYECLGNWRLGRKADLKFCQSYYRAPAPPQRGSRYGFERRAPPVDINRFPMTGQPGRPAADVLLALSKDNVAIEELQEAARRPQSRFPALYEDPVEVFAYRAWEPLLNCSLVLQLRASAELDNGQNEKALIDIELILHLAKVIREQRFITARLSCINTIESAIQPLWEGLVSHKWAEGQLVLIQDDLNEFNPLSDYQSAMREERARQIAWVEWLDKKRSLHGIWSAFLAPPAKEGEYVAVENSGVAATLFYLIPEGWFYRNELTIAKIFQQSIRTDDEIRHRTFNRKIADRSERAASVCREHPSPYNYLAGMAIQIDFARQMQKFAFAQSSIDLARVASALERFRLAHSEYPKSLDSLSPQFIDRVPNDLIDDQPLHYRRTDDGQYLLYSVGWDGIDDGGNVVCSQWPQSARVDMDRGDWVWPLQPLPLLKSLPRPLHRSKPPRR